MSHSNETYDTYDRAFTRKRLLVTHIDSKDNLIDHILKFLDITTKIFAMLKYFP